MLCFDWFELKFHGAKRIEARADKLISSLLASPQNDKDSQLQITPAFTLFLTDNL